MWRAGQCVVAICLFLASASQAQTQTLKPVVRADTPVVTRLVQSYTEYEQRLTEAIARHDTDEIDRVVADDFELRSAVRPGVPLPRADWIAQVLKEPNVPRSIEQVAVHDYGAIRIVSFVMKNQADRRHNREVAFVDVWMQSGESSVLKIRYSAPSCN